MGKGFERIVVGPDDDSRRNEAAVAGNSVAENKQEEFYDTAEAVRTGADSGCRVHTSGRAGRTKNAGKESGYQLSSLHSAQHRRGNHQWSERDQ